MGVETNFYGVVNVQEVSPLGVNMYASVRRCALRICALEPKCDLSVHSPFGFDQKAAQQWSSPEFWVMIVEQVLASECDSQAFVQLPGQAKIDRRISVHDRCEARQLTDKAPCQIQLQVLR